MACQPAILKPVPQQARYLTYTLIPGSDPASSLRAQCGDKIVAGLGLSMVFIALGASFDAYEAQLKRMTGAEDGITDGLFRFTRPLTGAYFWCPPLRDGRLDLAALGL